MIERVQEEMRDNVFEALVDADDYSIQKHDNMLFLYKEDKLQGFVMVCPTLDALIDREPTAEELKGLAS